MSSVRLRCLIQIHEVVVSRQVPEFRAQWNSAEAAYSPTGHFAIDLSFVMMLYWISMLCLSFITVTNATTSLTTPTALNLKLAPAPNRSRQSPLTWSTVPASVLVLGGWKPTSNLFRGLTAAISKAPQVLHRDRSPQVLHRPRSMARNSADFSRYPIPQPHTDESNVLLFHQQPDLFDDETCVLTILGGEDHQKYPADVERLLYRALKKISKAGYLRAGMVLSSDDIAYDVFEEVLPKYGFQRRMPKDNYKNIRTLETWVRELKYEPKKVPENVRSVIGNHEVKFTPKAPTMLTLSGAVPFPDRPQLFDLSKNELKVTRYGQREMSMNQAHDIFDMYVPRLRSLGHSHAAVVVDQDAGMDFFLEKMGFEKATLDRQQRLAIGNGELWLKKL